MPAPYRAHVSLADHIRDLANAFASAAGVLSQQYADLNKATKGLLDGTYPWKGQASDSFFNVWQGFGKYMQAMQKSCEDIHNSLIKFASKLDDIEAQEAWDALLTLVGGIMTVISFAAAIAEFGANPLADTLSAFFSGFTEQEGSSVVNIAEDITTADSEAATELQQIEEEMTSSPILTGPDPQSPGSLPDAVSPANLDNMTATDDLVNAQIDEDSSTFYSKGNANPYKNPINTGMQSTDANMPPGLNNPQGQSMLDECEQDGYIISWNAKAQQNLARADNSLGDTGIVYVNGQPRILIQLSPDADPAVLREEMLHAEQRVAQGMTGPKTPADVCQEEIKVEFQVLQEAESLNMTSADFDDLARTRQGYIDELKQICADNGLPWPPAGLAQYLKDPPKPPSLP